MGKPSKVRVFFVNMQYASSFSTYGTYICLFLSLVMCVERIALLILNLACHCSFISPFSRFFVSKGLSLPRSLAGFALNELGETDTSLEGLHLAVVEVTD